MPAAAQPGPLPDLLKVLDTMREIASAVAYMHTKDIIHGNLTGSSIMLCSSRKDSRGFTAKVGTQIHPSDTAAPEETCSSTQALATWTLYLKQSQPARLLLYHGNGFSQC